MRVSVKNWYMRVAIAYQEYKDKQKEFHKCAECKKTFLFDVPTGVISDEVDFICGKCVKKEKDEII